jgi:hypothetical protein
MTAESLAITRMPASRGPTDRCPRVAVIVIQALRGGSFGAAPISPDTLRWRES